MFRYKVLTQRNKWFSGKFDPAKLEQALNSYAEQGGHPEARIPQNAKVDLSFKIGAQLKNLNDVKREFVSKVKMAGGNCLLDFEYGQKNRWLAIDDVAFWGSGKIALLPRASYDEIISRK